MARRLTKRLIDAAEPGDKPTFLWDSDVAGFGVKLSPGGRKAFVLQYRVGRATKRYTIGSHGALTLDQARAEARRLAGIVAGGGDPQGEKAEARREMTVAQLFDRYFAEGSATKKASTLVSDRNRAETHILPALGNRMLSAVTRADVERLMRDVADGKTAEKARRRAAEEGRRCKARGGKGAASQVVILLQTAYAWAIDHKLVAENPAKGVKRWQVRKMERFLTASEMQALGDALDEFERTHGNPFPIAALRLYLFTGCRRAEILDLQWSQVDFERSVLRLPDSKTGEKVVMLSAPAREVLAGLPRIEGNPYVICGSLPGRRLVNLEKTWHQVRRAAGMPDLRLHDLRHSFASVGAWGGASLPMLGALLGHKDARTTARYAHMVDDPIRAVNDRIGERVAHALRGRPAAEVKPIRRGA